MAAQQEREIRFAIPEHLAQRIERLEECNPVDIARELMLHYYDDGRRTQIETHRLGINWHADVYKALLKHVGQGGVSRYVRQVIYDSLSRYEKDLLSPPDWSETHRERKVSRSIESTPGRQGYIAPIMIPKQWYERLSIRFPGTVGPWVKAMVQLDLEKQIGRKLPVQRTIAEFLGRDE